MASSIRVYELARELGLTNKETLDLCDALGIGVKSHSSSVVEAQADRVRRKAEREGLIREVQPEEPEAEKPVSKTAKAKAATPLRYGTDGAYSGQVRATLRSVLRTHLAVPLRAAGALAMQVFACRRVLSCRLAVCIGFTGDAVGLSCDPLAKQGPECAGPCESRAA